MMLQAPRANNTHRGQKIFSFRDYNTSRLVVWFRLLAIVSTFISDSKQQQAVAATCFWLTSRDV